MNLDEAVIVALGSNLGGGAGGPRAILEAAADSLTSAGLEVVRRSRWWRSRAWPDPAQPDYLNGVALVETSLTAEGALAVLQDIEARFGRTRREANAPRTLDLDLIAYGRLVQVGAALVVPHPRAGDRLFVMGPLSEIAPQWRHPVTGLTAQTLAKAASVGADASPT